MDLKSYIRTIPDYPKKGILFRDVTTLFLNPKAFNFAVHQIASVFADKKISKVAGIEARGFIIGGAVAVALGAGFVPIRKKGKLPAKTVSKSYELEYGEDVIEIHADAVEAGSRVVLIDDLIATGGTAQAAIELLTELETQIIGAAFLIDLPDLGGAEKLRANNVHVESLMSFEGH